MKDNNESIEKTGASVNEAISEALLHLGARRDEVEIEVLNEAKAGLLGIFGKKQARVRLSRKVKAGAPRRGRTTRPDNREKAPGQAARRPEREPRRDSAPGPAVERKGSPDEAPREERRRRPPRRRGPRKPDGAPAPQAATPVAQEAPQAAPQPRSSGAGERREEIKSAMPVGQQVAAVSLAPQEPAAGPDQIVRLQTKFSERLMALSGFLCRCTVVEGEYNQVKLVVDVDSAGILIGRHGYTIDAIEHLVERMTSRTIGDRVRMNLDINNYRLKRESKLEEMARDAVSRVRNGGGEDHLPPMNPRDRRIVHMQITDVEDMDTYTAGQGTDRHVVVITAKPDSGVDKRDDREPSTEDDD